MQLTSPRMPVSLSSLEPPLMYFDFVFLFCATCPIIRKKLAP